MLGFRLDELEPSVATWESLVHPDDWPGVRRTLDDHLDGRTPVYETEHRLRRKDGDWCWVLDPVDGTTNFHATLPLSRPTAARPGSVRRRFGLLR